MQGGVGIEGGLGFTRGPWRCSLEDGTVCEGRGRAGGGVSQVRCLDVYSQSKLAVQLFLLFLLFSFYYYF